MPPETRYVDSPKGQIAYQVMGEGPRDLVYLSGGTSHVDVRWESPLMTSFLERLASFSRLILFDRRGNGASEAVPVDAVPTWEEWADDLRVVMDAVDSPRAALFAVIDAGPMAMVFAAAHPERTEALVLGNTMARWVASDTYPGGVPRDVAVALLEEAARLWGTEDGAVRANPSIATNDRERAWLAKYARASATPRAFRAFGLAALDLDVRSVLPAIQAPTLILQQVGSLWGTQGHYLAEHIPRAQFAELPHADAALAYSDADRTLDLVEEFLTGALHPPDPDRVLATVLFTDLVDSTRRAAEVGDTKWRTLLDQHDDVVRREVGAHRGRVVKSTGDGVLAIFDAPGRAIRCTLALRSALTQAGLPIRAGLHAGEIELRGDEIGGIAVHIAARVSALAGDGEVVVSRTVSDLVAGSGVQFSSCGVHSLKGVPGEWELYRVEA